MPAQPVPTPESLAQAVWRRQRARWRVACSWRRQVQRCNATAVARRDAARLAGHRTPAPIGTAPVALGESSDRMAREPGRKPFPVGQTPMLAGVEAAQPYVRDAEDILAAGLITLRRDEGPRILVARGRLEVG